MLTAHNWRTIRANIISLGIDDPLSLTSLHALLDVTEKAVIESKNARERETFIDSLYRPTELDLRRAGTGEIVAPAGFEDGGESSFDAFLGTASL